MGIRRPSDIKERRMEATLAKLEAWLSEHAAPLRDLLNPPATAAEIAAFEAQTSLSLPPELRRMYAVHNGEGEGSDGIFGCRRWLPLQIVAEEIELIGSEGLIPFLRSGGGDLLYVRSPSTEEPDRGVYEWWHEAPEEATVIAESLEVWLADFVARLDAGEFVYRPDELAALIDRSELGEE